MSDIPHLIVDVSKAIFPMLQKHARETSTVATFSLYLTPNEEQAEAFRIHAYSDSMIQTRIFQQSRKTVVLGLKGRHVVEAVADGVSEECEDELVSEVIKQLKNLTA